MKRLRKEERGMSLNDQQQQKAKSWLSGHARLFPNAHECPYCGQTAWTTGDIISAPSLQNGGIVLDGRSVPMLQVVCTNCAYVRLFAAVPMGILE
jgi:predicted nucleic-acid-binding Zn-ribbon protein